MKRLILIALFTASLLALAPAQEAEAGPLRRIGRAAARGVSAPFRVVRRVRARRGY